VQARRRFTCTPKTNPTPSRARKLSTAANAWSCRSSIVTSKREGNQWSPGLFLLRRDSASGQRRQHHRRGKPAWRAVVQQTLLRAQLAGPARLNDSTARCWGMAQANLDNSGRPAFDTTRNGGGANATLCDCQFTDWSHDTNGGHVPGYTQTPTARPMAGIHFGNKRTSDVQGPCACRGSATTFAQWWVDSKYTSNSHIVSTLELGRWQGRQTSTGSPALPTPCSATSSPRSTGQ